MANKYIEDTRKILESAFNGEISADHFMVIEAMHMCMIAHKGQWRKSKRVMYALHPFRVWMIVKNVLGVDDIPCQCASLLHDVVEDTPFTSSFVRDSFGEETAGIVNELTRKSVSDDRDERSAALIESASHYSNRAIIVKSADRMDNLADAFVNFSDIKCWHYTKESIALYHALKSGLAVDEFYKSADKAVESLRCVILTMIEKCIDQKQMAKFNELSL